MPEPAPAHKPRIAISACLTGHSVRYNGGHKASDLCREQLQAHFDWLPVCPEVAIGLGVPATRSAWSATLATRRGRNAQPGHRPDCPLAQLWRTDGR